MSMNDQSELNDLHKKSSRTNFLLFAFSVFLSLLFIAIILHLSNLQLTLAKKSASETADTIAQVVLQMRSLYSDKVVSRVQYHGVQVSHDYQHYTPAIPLPATFTFELGQRLQQALHSKVSVDLYSPYPFAWRAEDGGLKDDFRRQAWSSLSEGKADTFVRVEEQAGQQFLRLALADVMNKQCVACHNSHKDSPKADWQEGDVRGILEVKYPLNESDTESLLSDLSLVLVAGGFVSLLFILFALSRHRLLMKYMLTEKQKAHEVRQALKAQKGQSERSEQNLKETTALLERSNAELQLQASEIELARLASLNLLQDVVKERDRALQAGAAKSMFLATMSHEIRTPMNGIIGMAQLLAETGLSDEQEKYIEIITSSGDLMLSIINDILEFTRFDSHDIELELLPFDLKIMLEDVCRIMANKAADQGLDFKLLISEECPSNVVGDAARLKQVLINLMANAIKFTEHGCVEIIVSRSNLSKSNNLSNQQSACIKFCVVDTGIGIAEEAQAHLFDAFTQADPSMTRKFGGTGLGLAISQKIVQQMSSQIEVESEEGKGSRFWFEVSLPLPEEQSSIEVRDTSVTQEESMPEAASISGNILVVEDNAMNQIVISAILEDTQASFDFAENGLEGLEKYQQGHYDLILMDCQMPIMDGYIATKEIRKLESSSDKHIPIIAVTANALASDKEACFEAGMDDFLPKPVIPGDLLRKLEKWLS